MWLNSGRPWLGCEECWLAPYKISSSFGFVISIVNCFIEFLNLLLFPCLLPFDWHFFFPGGKDNLVKLWDAKSGRELCSLWVHILVLINNNLVKNIYYLTPVNILQSWPQKYSTLCQVEPEWKLGANSFKGSDYQGKFFVLPLHIWSIKVVKLACWCLVLFFTSFICFWVLDVLIQLS